MGRPVEPVPEERAESYCAWLSQGRPAAEWHRIKGNPCRQTLDKWQAKDDEFRSRVARARDEGWDKLAWQALQIADTPQAGVTTTVDDSEKGGTKTVTEDMLGHRKLQVETRLKLLACWDPKRYGSKVQVGGDGGEPIKVVDKGEALRELASILATAAAKKG